ncbi:MAG: EAL domain-containing protein [Candidatus Omnitrophica bacterium]|nr:EAL domain-containing protein [Candidatus Omnitrophota bacterium]
MNTKRHHQKIHSIYTCYQPIIEIHSKKILGYEALTRGKGKIRNPGDLFGQAYEDGKTIDLDFECLRTAFKILPFLRKSESLFVNVEPITLGHSFSKAKEGGSLLRKILNHRKRIVFELTEGMKARDFDLIKKGVAFIRKKGYRFAIDDVADIGSRLSCLLSLKPHYMKIDVSLVRGIRESRLQQALVKRLVILAKKHSCHIIAEGVERKRDLELVREMGIPYVQGFYFARPIKRLARSGPHH